MRQQTAHHLRDTLTEIGSRDISVLIVHHHLSQLPNLDLRDRSTMVDSQELLDVLSDTGTWLVIHGHKHRAYTMYAAGGGGSPAVFSAGSFAARPTGDLATRARNQVYLLEFLTRRELVKVRLDFAIRIRSWTWDAVTGWAVSAPWPRDGIPGTAGMGWRASPHTVAEDLRKYMTGRPGEIAKPELYNWEPRLEFWRRPISP